MEGLSDTSDFTVDTSRDGSGRPVLVLSGEVDCSNADQLRRTVEDVLVTNPDRLTFDLSSLAFMDSSGIAVLVLAANEAPEIVVRNASPTVRRVLDATGLTAVLHLS